ncbi:MAG: methylated-DNA--[protein]-cysteine S-methyltransferase [Gammaproteobacteria bacterium]
MARTAAPAAAILFATTRTPLGTLLIAATDRGICSVQLGDDETALRQSLAVEFPRAHIVPVPESSRPVFAPWMNALREYLDGGPLRDDLPLDLQGTVFQQRVWRYLQTIPRGETRSYAEVAQAIGAPGASRAVGSACGSNRVALLVPCHRVLRGDGGDGGYRWGVARKRQLLAMERSASD